MEKWINDLSKTNADWVKNICNIWQKNNPSKETEKIIKRAMRTINQ